MGHPIAKQISNRMSYAVRNLSKQVLNKTAPALGERLRRAYWKQRMHGVTDLLAHFEYNSGLVVHQGPFAEMRLARVYSGSSLLPKIVGSYEDEISHVIEAVVQGEFDTIIDLGSAEGYYAVGFAMRCPGTRILAYDTNPDALGHLGELADLNGVGGRIECAGECTHDALEHAVRGRTFVLCDIEGAEGELLDPARCPALADCALLVETHVHSGVNTAPLIKSRFAPTHTMESFFSTIKDPGAYPCLAPLPERLRTVALDEMRIPNQEWVWCVPDNRA